MRHTLNCYCFDYWSRRLALEIATMTAELGHTVRLRDDTLLPLAALRQHGRRSILLINAYPDGLAVKMRHTGLGQHLDLLLSPILVIPRKISNCGGASASIQFLIRRGRCLSTTPMLDVANRFGIRYCLGVSNPDSGLAPKTFRRHPALRDYLAMLPALAGMMPDTPRRRNESQKR